MNRLADASDWLMPLTMTTTAVRVDSIRSKGALKRTAVFPVPPPFLRRPGYTELDSASSASRR